MKVITLMIGQIIDMAVIQPSRSSKSQQRSGRAPVGRQLGSEILAREAAVTHHATTAMSAGMKRIFGRSVTMTRARPLPGGIQLMIEIKPGNIFVS